MNKLLTLVAITCVGFSTACYYPPPPPFQSGLSYAVWADESQSRQTWYTLACVKGRTVVGSMHSVGKDWIIEVKGHWQLGMEPYRVAMESKRAVERYVDYYDLCSSRSTTEAKVSAF